MEQVEVSSIKELFTKAETNGGFEYLYVLVRIDGIQCYDTYKDEMVVLRLPLRSRRQSGSSSIPAVLTVKTSS